MLLLHNPYRKPSTTRGTFVGPPAAANIEFCGYLRKKILVNNYEQLFYYYQLDTQISCSFTQITNKFNLYPANVENRVSS